MTIFESIVLGIIEGVTEFLPISSTGHLILTSGLLGIAQTEFLKSFEIAIQLGAILSIVVLYFRSFLDIEVLKKLAVAFVPTGIAGLIFYKTLKTYFLGNESLVLWSLFAGGVALIALELLHKEPEETVETPVKEVSYRHSFLMGLCQAVAIIPGVSRSGATIVGGLLLGLKRTTVVEFSFLLAVPTMLAATGLDMYKNAGSFSFDQFGVLALGFAVSFIVAMGAVKFLLHFVRNHTFIHFGIYRIALALTFWLVIL